MAKAKQAANWQNRIVGEGVEAPDQLLANPSNWRIHPKYQQDALSAVLDNVGWVQRVIVNKTTGHIVDGHLRVSLAISRNEAEVPVVYVDLTEDEELTILATIDPLSAMAATDSAKLAELLASVQTDDAALEAVLRGVGETAGLDMGGVVQDAPEVDVDRAEELRIKWGVEYGDLWRVPSKHGGEHRILCGDSTNAADVARVMGGECAALLLTDPPYGVKRDEGFGGAVGFGGSGKPIKRRNYKDDWDSERPSQTAFNSFLASAEQSIIFGGNFFADLLPQSTHWIVWDKLNTMPTFGDCELAWTNLSRKSVKKITFEYNGLIGKEKERHHPTQKPAGLFAAILSEYSKQGDTVLDVYLGSGTTAVACEQLARRCYGIEISPAYVSVALERLSLMGLSPVRSDDDAPV